MSETTFYLVTIFVLVALVIYAPEIAHFVIHFGL